MTWTVVVDATLCEGNGVCEGIEPEVFRLERDDLVTVLEPTPAADRRPQVEQAVALCPKRAIAIVDS